MNKRTLYTSTALQPRGGANDKAKGSITIRNCSSVNNRMGGIYLGPGVSGVVMEDNNFELLPGTFGILDEGIGNVSRRSKFVASKDGKQPD